MAAAVASILLTKYIYGGPGEGSDVEALIGTQTGSISVPDAIFDEVTDEDPKYDDGVRAKITYRNDPTGKVIYTNETAAQLVAQSNGTVSAS